MYKDLLNILCCPTCKSEFQLEILEEENDEIIEGVLTCEQGHKYWIHQGVIDFCSKEQESANQWSEFYKEADYESIDQQIENSKSDKEKEQQKMVINDFISELTKMEKGVIVDIASGRGMLLTELAKYVKESIHIVATDLSFAVLMYDRIKLKKINPHLRISFMACDATQMPLKKASVDACVSFFGIANMLGIIDKGIDEASRILKKNGKLYDSFLLIKEESEGFEKMKEICRENQLMGAEKAYLEKDAYLMHNHSFENVVCDKICEDIKDKNEEGVDLFPYPGEWYAEVIYKCTK